MADLQALGTAGGAGLAGILAYKGVELILGRWFHRAATAVDSMPALDSTVKDLRDTVVKLQGLVQQVAEHDWKLRGMNADIQAIKGEQDAQRQRHAELATKLDVMAEKASHTENRADELREDLRGIAVKIDAFSDRVQNLIMESKRAP